MHKISIKYFILFSVILSLIAIGGYYIIGYSVHFESKRFVYQLYFVRIIIIIYILLGLITLLQNKNNIFQPIYNAVPLSLLRIVFFGIFSIGGIIRYHQLKEHFYQMSVYANTQNLPDALSRALWSCLPVSTPILNIALIILTGSAILAFIGFQTKLSTFLFSISAFYLFGIVNLTGKINHNHDLFWIPFLLTFSGCGDIFSIDALIKKRANKNLNGHIPNKRYTLAVFSFWIMLGICYFFPGFWKIWSCGLDWALTENIQFQMYYKWSTLTNYSPLIRIDRFPLIYKLGGLFTIWFEISFIFLLSFKRTRIVAIISGIIFHFFTYATMNIFFMFFVILYLVFINYSKIIPLLNRKKQNFVVNNPKPNHLKTAPILLFIGFIVYGILKIDSWPYSCYPRFDNIVSPFKYSITVEHCSNSKNCYELSKNPVRKKYSAERLAHLENEIIKNDNSPTKPLNQLNQIYMSCFNDINTGYLCFYLIQQSIHPDSPEVKQKKRISCHEIN